MREEIALEKKNQRNKKKEVACTSNKNKFSRIDVNENNL